MLHGCQKKIYHVRNVGGKYFDEAYLVMRDDCPVGERTPSKDLAAEADRIIRDATAEVRRSRMRVLGGAKTALSFALGALSSSAVIGTVAALLTLG